MPCLPPVPVASASISAVVGRWSGRVSSCQALAVSPTLECLASWKNWFEEPAWDVVATITEFPQ